MQELQSDVIAANISVFIMTKDEEVNIARCLESVRWSNDVVLLDSFSRDATLEIASGFPNVRIHQRAFTDYADQRNHGLNQIGYQNDWVFVLDADEVVEPALAEEMLALARKPAEVTGQPLAYMIRRRPVFGGKALEHNVTASCWIARLLRVGAVRYHGTVHERVVAPGNFGKLRGRLDHHQFAKGLDDWTARRLHYARLEHQMRASGQFPQAHWRDLLGADALRRRAALKECFVRLPYRWLLYLFYNLIISGAWRDGAAGIGYVRLEAQSIRRIPRAN